MQEKLWDDYGPLNIYMLPFIKPLHVRMAYLESDITTYTEAVKEAISHMEINPKQRNLLIAHQFRDRRHAYGLRGDPPLADLTT